MKRFLMVALVGSLLVGSVCLPAQARKKPKRVQRTAEGHYGNPAIGVPGVVGVTTAGGAVTFPLKASEAFISVEITDDSGAPVMATLSQETDPDNTGWDIFATICGTTDQALEVVPGQEVRIAVYTTSGPSRPTCAGPATAGDVKVTLSNLP